MISYISLDAIINPNGFIQEFFLIQTHKRDHEILWQILVSWNILNNLWLPCQWHGLHLSEPVNIVPYFLLHYQLLILLQNFILLCILNLNGKELSAWKVESTDWVQIPAKSVTFTLTLISLRKVWIHFYPTPPAK